MGRPRRIDSPGTWFHIFNRGAAHQQIYFDDRDRVDFERLLGVVHDRFGLVVHSYCLMGNHYHLLAEAPEGGLSEAMQVVGSSFVRHVNDRIGRDGPLFRGRFSAKPVLGDEYRLRLVRYIHRNPLAFLDETGLRSYRWSSLRSFMGHRRPPQWLEAASVLDMVGGASGFESLVFDESIDGRGSVPIVAWPEVIDLILNEQLDEVRQGTGRTVAALLLDQLDGFERCELARHLDFPTSQAERSALSRARRRANEQPELYEVAAQVIRFVA